ncbi:hypothetical protein M3B43_09280 [Nesterenkonia massiliensis]|uniref:N-acetyltransferase domain-containing protein n=1 Tax=Nesterenkonia massiliensis TaxID=1232429 RepID=A0ABT2HS32_9MICC|nr:hypothetical protein [Nesterenkonia massiliensis]MCT1607512.1 hypothetical protein [Nesterenkonia massiliensis]
MGVVAINGSHQHQLGWFFYWVHPDTRVRGVMSQAAAAGFLQEGLEREKFEVGGERVNVLTYGRLRSDPPAVVGHLPLRCQQKVTCS